MTASQIAREIAAKNYSAVRGIVDVPTRARLCAFAQERLVKPRDPGNNMLFYLSEKDGDEYRTDLWLVRAVLNRQLVGIAEEYFERVAGTRSFCLRYGNLLIRHFDRAWSAHDHYVPYHQDGAALPRQAHWLFKSRSVPEFRIINAWTPLYPLDGIGDTSPGIEINPRRLRYLVPVKSAAKSSSHVYAGMEAKPLLFSRAVTPRLALGDVLMFNELCLHRTQMGPAIDRPRVSAEIRLFAETEKVREEQKTGIAYALVRGNAITWPSRWRLEGGQIKSIETETSLLY